MGQDLLTPRVETIHNRAVPLRTLIVLFGFLSLWALTEPFATVPSRTGVATEECSPRTEGRQSGNSDARWHAARHQRDATISQSIWTSSQFHAGLAGAPCAVLPATVHGTRPSDPRRHVPPRLLPGPLLI